MPTHFVGAIFGVAIVAMHVPTVIQEQQQWRHRVQHNMPYFQERVLRRKPSTGIESAFPFMATTVRRRISIILMQSTRTHTALGIQTHRYWDTHTRRYWPKIQATVSRASAG